MIKIDRLVKNFGEKNILNDISFNVKEGDIFALVGPNGAGKTTTLRCLFGDLQPDSGSIKIFDSDLNSSTKKRIAVITEDRLIFKRFKGTDYVKLWKMLYPNWSEKIFSSFLNHYKFPLSEKVDNYSMGMKTLLQMALSLSTDSDLLILDEPTQNLDPVIRQEVMDVLKNFSLKERKTIIISSHEIYELEEIASAFAIIYEGKIIYADTMDEAKEKHRVVERGDNIPENSVIIGNAGDKILVKTDEEIGNYATFNNIVLGYLKNQKKFDPFTI